MPRISLDQARSGMVLAADVSDRRGRLLMPSGRAVTDQHLAAFRMWGVAVIEVLGEEPSTAVEPSVDYETLARADEVVRDLFGIAGLEHAYLRELGKIARSRTAKELARKASEVT